jgi:hypothetical protein
MKNDQNDKIVNTLLLNASFIDNIGLMHGKMGLSIFFFHLARRTKSQMYEDYAGELIDEIYDELSGNTPMDFENGLAGIGWGIEYLVQNCFLEADTDEVLEEFDNRLFQQLIYDTPSEIGLLKGLLGIGFYYLKRLQNTESNDEKIQSLTNKQTLIHLIDELDRRLDKEAIDKLLNGHNQDASETENTTSKPIIHNFDITWDYTATLWFLTDLFSQNIFNHKVTKIVINLLTPLTTNNLELLSETRKLLIIVVLTKLKKNIKFNGKDHDKLESIHEYLSRKIDIKLLGNELATLPITIRHGISGIYWLSKQIFKTPNDDSCLHLLKSVRSIVNQEARIGKPFSHDKFINSYDDQHSFGLLEGIAGIDILTN